MASWLKTSTLSLIFALSLLPACKQGLNEVCQVDDDCEQGLECDNNLGRCRPSASQVIDAAAPPIDSRPVDAPVEEPDAAEVDAAPPDAAAPDATQ